MKIRLFSLAIVIIAMATARGVHLESAYLTASTARVLATDELGQLQGAGYCDGLKRDCSGGGNCSAGTANGECHLSRPYPGASG